MSLVQRIVYAIRTLTEDDPPNSRKTHRRRHRNNTRHQQAVALVITFRDLFASGGLNHLLEDPDRRKPSSKRSNVRDSKQTPADQISPAGLKVPKLDFTSDLTLPTNLKLAPAEAWYVDLSQSPESVPYLHEERIISTSELALMNSSISSSSVAVAEVEASSREVAVLPRGWRRKKKEKNSDLVVSLATDDENKTVAALRKVLKWSPRKQSAATFALQVPTEEQHKAVAVVENAVNRVKEEQQQQKKKKLRLFKLTFC